MIKNNSIMKNSNESFYERSKHCPKSHLNEPYHQQQTPNGRLISLGLCESNDTGSMTTLKREIWFHINPLTTYQSNVPRGRFEFNFFFSRIESQEVLALPLTQQLIKY